MSAVADRALSIPKPETPSSNGIWVPLLGGVWVLVNVALAALGIYIDWPILCAFLARVMNGSLLSVIVVATASDRFQAGTTGPGRVQPERPAQRWQHSVESHAESPWLCRQCAPCNGHRGQ